MASKNTEAKDVFDKTDELDYQACYDSIMKTVGELLGKDVDPLMVAAVISTIGFSLYRTMLDDDDYDEMVDAMSNLRDQIKTIQQEEKGLLH